jgi:hypothetical protein
LFACFFNVGTYKETTKTRKQKSKKEIMLNYQGKGRDPSQLMIETEQGEMNNENAVKV